MYQLTGNPGIVRCTESSTFIPKGHRSWSLYKEWLAAGNTAAPAESLLSMTSTARHQLLRSLAWDWMTPYALRLGHDSIENCCSYISSTVPRYAKNATHMIAWRDAVSVALEGLTEDWPADIETWEQVRAALPQPHMFDLPKQEHTP
ncbi:MAG: hypothetical protein JF596_15465 [Stenotrophomonas sp.]|nr:hypothetical protein [Stenotrophomonas sp.]